MIRGPAEDGRASRPYRAGVSHRIWKGNRFYTFDEKYVIVNARVLCTPGGPVVHRMKKRNLRFFRRIDYMMAGNGESYRAALRTGGMDMPFAVRIQNRRLPVLWRLAWPAIIEQLLGTLVSYVDTAMVGALGANATAAVSINAACIWLVNGILSGIGVGYSVQVANAIGAEDAARARAVTRQGVLAAGVFGLASLTALEVLAGFLPRWLGAEPEVLPGAVAYLRFYALGLPFSTALFVFSAILRCGGDTRTPLILNTLANAVNVALNFFLIYESRTVRLGIPFLTGPEGGLSVRVAGAGMGVGGAALASALSLAVAAILLLRTVLWNHNRPLICAPEENFRPDRAIIREALRLGLPYIGERVTVNAGQIFMTWLVSGVGTVALAANQIATTAEGLCYLPAYGVSFAATALVGQSVGARREEDAQVYGTLAARLAFLLCVGTAAALFAGAELLAGLFTPDKAVIAETARALRIVSLCEPFFALSIVYSGALRGAKDVRFPMAAALCSMWGVRAVLAPVFVFALDWGLAGVWTAMALDLTVRGAVCALRWRRGRWKALSGLETT